MDPLVIVAVVLVVAIAAVGGWYLWQRRRTEQLQATYGPEYSRTVEEVGDRRRAESELLKRRARVEHFEIHPLSMEEFSRFTSEWRVIQAQFVDEPKRAVSDADLLVEEVMKVRGYPVGEFEQRAADLSVHHPRVVQNYRAAREIAVRHRRGDASTEDLRQAMVYYRELFEDLLEDRESELMATDRETRRVVHREAPHDGHHDDIRTERPGRLDQEARQ
jgi:hypothetical protein